MLKFYKAEGISIMISLNNFCELVIEKLPS